MNAPDIAEAVRRQAGSANPRTWCRSSAHVKTSGIGTGAVRIRPLEPGHRRLGRVSRPTAHEPVHRPKASSAGARGRTYSFEGRPMGFPATLEWTDDPSARE